MIEKIYPLVDRPDNLIERLVSALSLSAGYCPVCRWPTAFVKWNKNYRETGYCLFCRAKNRHRQIAYVLDHIYKNNPAYTSLCNTSLAIYNTETSGPLHRRLVKNTNYIASEYLGDEHQSGQVSNNIRHEDLQRLSFEDNSFDLVLSSDVFEHIPDPYRAHAEILRVLRPGGRHVFTVPFYQTLYCDETRAIVTEGNKVEHLQEPLYHIDPMQNHQATALVYTIFSLEMLGNLSKLGFYTNMYRSYSPIRGMLGYNGLVFEAIKG